MSKLISLSEAGGLVRDGQMIALGGNSLSRTPSALGVGVMVRLVGAGAYEIDLLCAAGAVAEVRAGYIGYENLFGMAPSYRRGVESGEIRVVEHACYSVIAGLRASAYGLPSQPVSGFDGSDTPASSGFLQAEDPYTGKSVYMIPKIRPDWAVVHVQHADAAGNARIDGGPFEDVLLSRASEGVILTAERIVETKFFEDKPERTNIPGFMVDAVVHLPGGAAPASCYPLYDTDEEAVAAFLGAADSPESLRDHLREWEVSDHRTPEAEISE